MILSYGEAEIRKTGARGSLDCRSGICGGRLLHFCAMSGTNKMSLQAAQSCFWSSLGPSLPEGGGKDIERGPSEEVGVLHLLCHVGAWAGMMRSSAACPVITCRNT